MKIFLGVLLFTVFSIAHAQDRELLEEVQHRVNASADIAGPDHALACRAGMQVEGFGNIAGASQGIYQKCLAYLDEKANERKNLDTNVAAIKAGTRAPANFDEAQKAYEALNGFKLAQSPMIRADGKTYAIFGKIYRADDQTAVFMGKVIGLNDQPNYVGVKVPKELEALYFEKARVNGSFTVVGTYTRNLPFIAVTGEKGQMPVLEARYLELRD